jgi:thiol-disulfide isomerase/thioredoxin
MTRCDNLALSKERPAMDRRATLLAAWFLVLSVSLCGGQESSVFVVRERTPEPAFTLPDVNGRPVSSKNFAGKVAVVSFGATWCASCVSELPSLANLQTRFVDDVVVYFVALDGRGEKDVKPFIEKTGFRLPTLLDPHMSVAREHGVRSIPETVIVDRQGVMVARAVGPRVWDGKEAQDLVQSLIKR